MGDLVCAQLIDTGGFFDANFCSECSDTTPCPEGQTCSPHYDTANYGGWMECVEPGSVPNNQGCPLDDMGNGDDSVCMSGHCEAVDAFMGFVQLGVCGECSEDMDCMMGQTCMPGVADMSGLMGTTCG
jgi:Cys-rich repeat protein